MADTPASRIRAARMRMSDRRNRKVTQTDIASRCGWTQSRFSKLENNEIRVDAEDARVLASILGVTPEWLLFGDEDVPEPKAGARRLPLVPVTHAARAIPEPENEGYPDIMVDELDSRYGMNAMAVIVDSDAMEPTIRNGDILIVSPYSPPSPGDIVVSSVEPEPDSDAVLRRWYDRGRDESGAYVFELAPDNPAHQTFRCGEGRFCILVGKAIEHRRFL